MRHRLRAIAPYFALGLMGAAAAFAMAPYGFYPALFTLGALVAMVARAARPLHAALYSAAYAFGFFIFGLYWVQNALGVTMGDAPWLRPVALVGLPLLLVPFWAAAGWVTARLFAPGGARAFAFVGLLAVCEYLRGFLFTGFPWNYFGYAWGAADLPAAQFSGLAGIHVLNALTLLWAAGLGLWLYGRWWALALSMVAGLLPNAYGVWRLAGAESVMRADVGVVVVQPNIAQAEKWDPAKQFDHFMQHISLSQEGLARAQDSLAGVEVVAVLWPETAIEDFALAKDPRMTRAIEDMLAQARPFKVRLVSGVLRQEGGRYYNSIVSIDRAPDGGLAAQAIYDKHRLVPFGEYVPLIERFGFDATVTGFSGFAAGTGAGLIDDGVLPPAAGQVCYEAIFAQALPPGGDAAWIINVSNDGWYGDTSGPYQHLGMSRHRALEHGMPMVRSTTTGISAVIDSYGRVLDSIPYGQSGVIVSALPEKITPPALMPYMRDGVFFGLMLVWMGAAPVFSRRKH